MDYPQNSNPETLSQPPEFELPDLQNPPAEPEFELPEPNPVTMGWHRKQVLRMITLPMIVALIGFLAACVLAWSATSAEDSLWADISLSFLAIMLAFGLFLGIIISAGLAYLFFYLTGLLPPYTRLLQDYSDKIRRYTRTYSDKAVEPIIKAESRSAAAKQLRQSLSRRARQ